LIFSQFFQILLYIIKNYWHHPFHQLLLHTKTLSNVHLLSFNFFQKNMICINICTHTFFKNRSLSY